jgi:hypothetical protein
LYNGDRISTDGASNATLLFFDGTSVTLDNGSTVLLSEAIRGEKSGMIALAVEGGRVSVESGTGRTVTRTVGTSLAHHIIPPSAEVIVGASPDRTDVSEDLYVFSTTGPGIETTVRSLGRSASLVVVGEGQELHLDPEKISEIKQGRTDPYTLRSAMDTLVYSSLFYLYTQRKPQAPVVAEAPVVEETTVDGEQLVVDSPEDGKLVEGSTVLVKGRVGSRVSTVKVNGYDAELSEGAYQKEIALPDEEEFSVEIQAEDKDGLIVATKSLSLSQDIQPPASPVINSPGKAGDTVQVHDDSFEIIGTSSPDTTSIVVNGYQLQKFRTGGTWEYLVDPKIGNVVIGENTYEVVALDRSGNSSTPVNIVIVWKAETLPTIDDDEATRDDGVYLDQGSLSVIAPTDGAPHRTSATEVLIEGFTSSDTHAISVNGFSLGKYLPGKTTWNYIAKAAFANYHTGVNRYTVVARNSEGKILDVLQYVIEKE